MKSTGTPYALVRLCGSHQLSSCSEVQVCEVHLQWGIQRTCLGPHGASRKVAKLEQSLWENGRRHGRLLLGPASRIVDSVCVCQQKQHLRAHLSRQQRRRRILGTWRLLLLFLPFHCMDDLLLHWKDSACDTANRTECPKCCKARNVAKRA